MSALAGRAGGGSWSRPTRPREDKHPTQVKLRWEVTETCPKEQHS